MEHRFKTTFTSVASICAASQDELKIAKASLEPLRHLLPPEIDPAESPDLLYISANGACANLVNKNRDGITKESAVAIHASAKNKFINVSHSRDEVIGVVLYPALTKFGTNEILTDEEALAMTEPFNMSFAGVLWKTVSPMIANYVTRQGASTGGNVLSISWEIAFSSYAISLGDKDIAKARLIKSDDPSFAAYDKMLAQNGGEGKDPKGNELYRVIDGDAIILGYSVVPNPAAEVKGILPIEKAATPAEALADINEILQLSDDKLKDFASELFRVAQERGISFESALPAIAQTPAQKTTNSSITPTTIGVTPNTANSMKIETIEQLESALGKHEAAAAAVDFVKAIHDASEKFAQDARAKDDLLKTAEEAKAVNEQLAKDLKDSLAKVNKTLAEVQASQEAAVANQKFQERMASFDEQFDLDDEDRKLIASDIKDLDENGFATYAKKQGKLMCGKAKKKAPPADKKTDPADDDADDAKAAAKAAADAKLAIASVTEITDQAKLPNTVTVSEDLKTQMATAFAGSVKIDGETVAERKAKKSKK